MSSPYSSLTPKERDTVHLALTGESIIDWPRFHFKNLDEVRHFLRINEYHLEETKDSDRLMAVHNEAVGYLRGHLHLNLSEELMNPQKILEVFLAASDFSNPALQSQACALLKTMHVINHIDGQELIFHCPIMPRDLYSLVCDKIERVLSGPIRKKVPALQYTCGRKQKESLITRLLAKRSTPARNNDKVRYQIVVPTRQEVLEVLLLLFDSVVPMNYVVPGQSVNDLFDEKELLELNLPLPDYLHRRLRESADKKNQPHSVMATTSPEYSGKSYHVMKFTADLPVRMDRYLEQANILRTETLGCITHLLVEFQIIDEATFRENNQGENEHSRYKERQKLGVNHRLTGTSK